MQLVLFRSIQYVELLLLEQRVLPFPKFFSIKLFLDK